MSSFLKRNINQEDPDEDEELEEQYKRLFKKIGRDFVAKDDLKTLLSLILETIDPLGLTGLQVDDSAARDLAERYQRLLDKGKDGGESKRDLIESENKKKKE